MFSSRMPGLAISTPTPRRASAWRLLLAGVALWGRHRGRPPGLLAAMVADTAPEDLRGTAYGFFNLLSGAAMLVSSVVAGLLWDLLGPAFSSSAISCERSRYVAT